MGATEEYFWDMLQIWSISVNKTIYKNICKTDGTVCSWCYRFYANKWLHIHTYSIHLKYEPIPVPKKNVGQEHRQCAKT